MRHDHLRKLVVPQIRDLFHKSITSFLTEALSEEMRTQRAWVLISHPEIANPEELSREQLRAIKPYPVIYKAEDVINWKKAVSIEGTVVLQQIVIKSTRDKEDTDEFHPETVNVIKVHELDEAGLYQIRVFEEDILVDTITNIRSSNKRLTTLPAFPLNGSIEVVRPLMTTIIDKEISLYNKISRRNHLLYGAATYTPVVYSDMNEDDFDTIVDAGLGSWLKAAQGDKIEVLKTPTEALKDLDRSIKDGIEEIAQLGVRMLAKDSGDQSGVALQIRAANQNVTLGNLSVKISQSMTDIIAYMLSWYNGQEVLPSDITFILNDDFQTIPLDHNYISLVSSWYQEGLIPRSLWLLLMQDNELIPSDYDDDEGTKEIGTDELIQPQEDDYEVE